MWDWLPGLVSPWCLTRHQLLGGPAWSQPKGQPFTFCSSIGAERFLLLFFLLLLFCGVFVLFLGVFCFLVLHMMTFKISVLTSWFSLLWLEHGKSLPAIHLPVQDPPPPPLSITLLHYLPSWLASHSSSHCLSSSEFPSPFLPFKCVVFIGIYIWSFFSSWSTIVVFKRDILNLDTPGILW